MTRSSISASAPLLLRPWTEEDTAGLREAVDEDVDHLRPWLGWTLEEPATMERTRARLREWADQHRRGVGLRWAVTPADLPSRILGGAGLNFRVGPGAHDVGYWVRKSAARQGIAASAVAALAGHAFDRRGVDRLVIRCDVGNAASEKLALSIGFRAAGSATIAYPDGSPRSVQLFELDREAFEGHLGGALRERARRVRLVTGE